MVLADTDLQEGEAEQAFRALAFRVSLKPTIVLMSWRVVLMMIVGDMRMAFTLLGGIIFVGVCLAAVGRHDEHHSHTLYSHVALVCHIAILMNNLSGLLSCDPAAVEMPMLALQGMYIFAVHVAVAPPLHRTAHVVLAGVPVLFHAASKLRGGSVDSATAMHSTPGSGAAAGAMICMDFPLPDVIYIVGAAWNGSSEHRARLGGATLLLAQAIATEIVGVLIQQLMRSIFLAGIRIGASRAPQVDAPPPVLGSPELPHQPGSRLDHLEASLRSDVNPVSLSFFDERLEQDFRMRSAGLQRRPACEFSLSARAEGSRRGLSPWAVTASSLSVLSLSVLSLVLSLSVLSLVLSLSVLSPTALSSPARPNRNGQIPRGLPRLHHRLSHHHAGLLLPPTPRLPRLLPRLRPHRHRCRRRPILWHHVHCIPWVRISPHLTSPHLTSPHLTLPHLTSPLASRPRQPTQIQQCIPPIPPTPSPPLPLPSVTRGRYVHRCIPNQERALTLYGRLVNLHIIIAMNMWVFLNQCAPSPSPYALRPAPLPSPTDRIWQVLAPPRSAHPALHVHRNDLDCSHDRHADCPSPSDGSPLPRLCDCRLSW